MLTGLVNGDFIASIAVGAHSGCSRTYRSWLLLLKGKAPFSFWLLRDFLPDATQFELIAIHYSFNRDLMLEGAISKALVNLAKSMLVGCGGSLALATTWGCVFWCGIGSGPATASAVGSIVAQPMLEEGYPKP